MRTQQEIIGRFSTLQENGDFFGFRREVLLGALTFESAQEVVELKEGVTKEMWEEDMPRDPAAEARDYLAFAVGKALDHRGLSANRSVDKLSEWLWLLEDEALLRRFESAPYPQYGAPKLWVLVNEWDVDLGLTGFRRESWLRMARGHECRSDGCLDGCGS